MKFNKKSLVRLAILSSILGLNGFCGVANAMEAPDNVIQSGWVIVENQQQNNVAVDNKKENEQTALECSICLGEITEDCVSLPCGHNYHGKCIKGCLSSGHSKCPNCRSDVHAQDVKEIKLGQKCSECGLTSGLMTYTASGTALCNGCISKNTRGNKLDLQFIAKYKLTTGDRVSINNWLPEDQKLKTDGFNLVVKPVENTEQRSNNNDRAAWYRNQTDEAVLNGLDDDKIESAVARLDCCSQVEKRYSDAVDTMRSIERSIDGNGEDWDNVVNNWQAYVSAYQKAQAAHEELMELNGVKPVTP